MEFRPWQHHGLVYGSRYGYSCFHINEELSDKNLENTEENVGEIGMVLGRIPNNISKYVS